MYGLYSSFSNELTITIDGDFPHLGQGAPQYIMALSF